MERCQRELAAAALCNIFILNLREEAVGVNVDGVDATLHVEEVDQEAHPGALTILLLAHGLPERR